MKGADPNYQNSEGQTPFHVACERGQEILAQIFYESGADPEVRDAQLRTVWKCCSEEFKAKVIPPPFDDGSLNKGNEGFISPQDSQKWLTDHKCFLCQQLDADRVLLPCKHKVLCHKCASQFFEQYSSCPQCYMAVYAAVKE